MPMLSIVIPTFNSSVTIGRCLASIGNQAFSDFEVVIQDGCSTDDTVDLVCAFQRANDRIEVRTERVKDCGAYDAMNRAVCRARGTWLYFLGSDDELHDENVLGIAMSREHTENNDVLYGDVRIVGDCWVPHDSIYDGSFDLVKLLRSNICHQAIFYRADLVRRVGGYNLDYAVYADWDLNLRCWALTKFTYINLVVAKFHAGGISSQSDKRFPREIGAQVMRDFGFSLLDPVVNDPRFVGRPGIVEMQKAKGRLYALSGLVLRVVLKLRWLAHRGVKVCTGHFLACIRRFRANTAGV